MRLGCYDQKSGLEVNQVMTDIFCSFISLSVNLLRSQFQQHQSIKLSYCSLFMVFPLFFCGNFFCFIKLLLNHFLHSMQIVVSSNFKCQNLFVDKSQGDLSTQSADLFIGSAFDSIFLYGPSISSASYYFSKFP